MWALTLLACAGAPGEGDSAGDSGDSAPDSGDSGAGDSGTADSGAADSGDSGADTGDDGSFVELPPPSWSVEEVEARIDAALAAGLPDPFLPRDELATWIATYGDSNCPGTSGLSFATSFNGCHATSAWTFGGYGEYAEEADGVGFLYTADVFVEDPSRRRFDAAGQLSITFAGSAFTALVVGTWGGDIGDGWVDGGPSVALWMDGDAASTRIDGGYTPDDALFFDGIEVRDGAATGELRLRDPNGSWYRLPLDADGSGCGTVGWGDDALGAACVDLAAAVADLRARIDR